MNLEINGRINLGPNWHQYYRALNTGDKYDAKSQEEILDSSRKTDFRSNVKETLVKDIKFIAGSKLIQLLKNLNFSNIVSNVQLHTGNGSLRNLVHASDKREELHTTKEVHKKHRSKKHKSEGIDVRTEHNNEGITEKTEKTSHKKRKHRAKSNNNTEDTPVKVNKEKGKETKVETTAKTTEEPKVTTIIDKHHQYEIFLSPMRVKDDPQLVDHIQHIYAQAIKVINDLKTKTDNYKLKKDIDLVLRSYDEKFKEFVKENKYHKVKSRLGRKKVILNVADTSNKILDRLVTYVHSKVDSSGLRSGVANILHNALQKKVELENKRICSKFAICRAERTFRHFLIDLFSIVLNSNDDKIMQFHNAMTEVMKTRDLSKIMDSDTEKSFRKGIRGLEAFNLITVKAGFLIVRNILEKIHEPIKVTNTNSKSVNKTVAFIDLIDIFEEKIPPNERNKLEWEDMLNSMKQWSRDERKDILEIYQTVTDHIKKAIDSFDDVTAKKVQQNLYTMIN